MEDNKDIRKVVLIVTQNCNLECIYCYENYKSPQVMEYEVAKNIIDFEVQKYASKYNITIEFFGGEPFLNFELINKIFEYCESKYANIGLRYCATTNGTVLTNDIKNWLEHNKSKFECSLSLDGTKDMHNINRPFKGGKGSFSYIDIDFFKYLYKSETRVKMTVSKETLPYLKEGICFLDSLGVHTVADLVAQADYWSEEELPELEKQLLLLIEYYSHNSLQSICRMLDYDLRRVFIDESVKFQYCGAGKNMITYDIDGKWYPCMALAPVSQGNKAEMFIRENFDNFKFDKKNMCKSCKLLRLCRNCYATNYNQTGDVQNQTPIQCKMNRMLLAASCMIQFNRISAKSEIDNNDKWILKAIWKVQEALKNDVFI